MWVAFANAKATHIFSAKIFYSIYYAIFNDQSLNDILINNIVSFEQLGSVNYLLICQKTVEWVANSVDPYMIRSGFLVKKKK